jgi:cystathionine beta-lyase
MKQADGAGGLLSFELRRPCSLQAFFSALKIISPAEGLGAVESLICHPATMTHAVIPPDVRAKMGVSDRLIRLAVGIEGVSGLIADLESAFSASRSAQHDL